MKYFNCDSELKSRTDLLQNWCQKNSPFVFESNLLVYVHAARDLSRRAHRLRIRLNISHRETCLVHGDRYFIGLHVVVAALPAHWVFLQADACCSARSSVNQTSRSGSLLTRRPFLWFSFIGLHHKEQKVTFCVAVGGHLPNLTSASKSYFYFFVITFMKSKYEFIRPPCLWSSRRFMDFFSFCLSSRRAGCLIFYNARSGSLLRSLSNFIKINNHR